MIQNFCGIVQRAIHLKNVLSRFPDQMQYYPGYDGRGVSANL
jgi:hypothetical protein